MRKVFALLLSFVLVLSLCACNTNPDPTTPSADEATTYSVGLREDGFYVDYESLAPEYTYDLEISEQELKNYITTMLQEDQQDPSLTFDNYLDMFANNLLSGMGLDIKEYVEESDIVNVSLQFFDKEGKEIPDYTKTGSYTAKENADNIISSFIGHKAGDQYSIEYTFPADDAYYPAETVTVNVVVNQVFYADPLNSGVVEQHLAELNEVLVGVENVQTLKTALIPYVFAYHLQDYIETTVIQQDIAVPETWVEYEYQRLLSRLEALDLTYEQYLESAELTEENVLATCKELACKNLVALAFYTQNMAPLTEADLEELYGAENIEYYVTLQGRPYIMLRAIRTYAFFEMAKTTKVVDTEGNPIDLSMYFGEESSEDLNDNEIAPEENTDLTN